MPNFIKIGQLVQKYTVFIYNIQKKIISRRLPGFGAEKAGTGPGTGKLKKAGKAGNRAGIPVGH